jgi:hypothetical protein
MRFEKFPLADGIDFGASEETAFDLDASNFVAIMPRSTNPPTTAL